MSTTQNETAQVEGKAEKPRMTKNQVLAQACQIGGVLLLTGGLLLLITRPDWFAEYSYGYFSIILGLLMLAAFVFLLIYAVQFTYRFNKETEEKEEKAKADEERTRYIITEHRIATLRAANVPKDVRDYLATLIGQNFIKKELLARLEETLGPERTNETSAVILKYTKTYLPL